MSLGNLPFGFNFDPNGLPNVTSQTGFQGILPQANTLGLDQAPQQKPPSLRERINAIFSGNQPGFTDQQNQSIGQRSLLGLGASLLANSGRTHKTTGQIIGEALGASLGQRDVASNQILKQMSLQGKAESTPIIKEALAIGLKQGTPEFEKFIRDFRMKQTGTTVNISQGAESTFQKENAKLQAKRLDKINTSADDARNTLVDVETIGPALKAFGAGRFGEAKLALGQFARGIGLDPDSLFNTDISQGEVADAISKKLALKNRKEMPGPMSDSDRKFLTMTVAGIGKTPEANTRMLEITKRVAQRRILRAVEAEKWQEENGTLRGFRAYWNKFMRENPMFTGVPGFKPTGRTNTGTTTGTTPPANFVIRDGKLVPK